MHFKVCGLQNTEQVNQLNEKLDFLGFIYYKKSRRFVLQAPPGGSGKRVGVFVDESMAEILRIIERDQLDFVQLHGRESVETAFALRQHARIIKAFGIEQNFDFDQLRPYADVVDYFLFDTASPQHGGSGRTFSWDHLRGYELSVPFLLSGGLSPALLPEILAFRHPQLAGFDLNSGFETKPGVKNVPQILEFIQSYHAHI